MKKIIFVIILIIAYFIIIHHKLMTVFIEKVDLNLQDNEIAIIFLSSPNYKTILINDNDINALLAIDISSYKGLKNNINKFINNKLDYLFINKNINSNNIDIDYFMKDNLKEYVNMNKYNILKNDNIIKISNKKYNLCIYDLGDNSNISDCNFIYFINMNRQIKLNENLLAIFYEKNIKEKFKENTYIKWIDNYELSTDTYTILKLSNNTYDIITIPIQN